MALELHPLRSAARCVRTTSARLYRNVLEILAEAVERRGSSIDDYTAPDGDGAMQEHLDVYQRTGEPCQRCGRPIRRIVIGIRATHFCSFCQRLPAAERPAAAKLLATMTPRPGARRAGGRGRRWVELDGDGALAGRPTSPRRPASGRPGRRRRRPRGGRQRGRGATGGTAAGSAAGALRLSRPTGPA